ncbi:2909_t:CDS:1, partial [Acaulospora colombiana]
MLNRSVGILLALQMSQYVAFQNVVVGAKNAGGWHWVYYEDY